MVAVDAPNKPLEADARHLAAPPRRGSAARRSARLSVAREMSGGTSEVVVYENQGVWFT
jgi:hypothetical protein